MTTPRRRLQRIAADFNKKARQYGVPGVVTGEMLASIDQTCRYCGVKPASLMDGTWDHVVPFARGGTNELTNIVRACGSCNRTKHTKLPEELEAYRALLVTCPVDGTVFKPRWSEWKAGRARHCSLRCAALARWARARGASGSSGSRPA